MHLSAYCVGCRFCISANTINYYCLEEEDNLLILTKLSFTATRVCLCQVPSTYVGWEQRLNELPFPTFVSVYSVISKAAASPADAELVCPALALLSGGR